MPETPEAEAPQEQPSQVDEAAAANETEVSPELKDEFGRWMNLMRGNERLERELVGRGRAVDPLSFAFMRLDAIALELLGDPRKDKRRLDFEIRFAEDIRSMLSRTKLSVSQQEQAKVTKLHKP